MAYTTQANHVKEYANYRLHLYGAEFYYSPSFFAATQLQWTNKVQERKIQALVLGLSSI